MDQPSQKPAGQTVAAEKPASLLVKVLAGLAIAVVLLAILIAMRPSEFHVARSTTIAAPPADVFARVNDMHRFQEWNPWGKLDPEMKQTFDGPNEGVGASYAWVGNSNVGEGKMTIAESKPDELVRMKLEFFKPMAGTNDVQFTFEPRDGATVVTWAMDGHHNFLGKAFTLFMSMDKMIGDQFEKGLADLKSGLESEKS